MERDDAFQAVRDFSKKVRDEIPEDPLGQGLAKKVDIEIRQEQQGKRLFGESADLALKTYVNGQETTSDIFSDVSQLDEVCAELEKSWEQVLQEIAKKDGKKKHQQNQPNQSNDNPKPNIETVLKLVAGAQNKLEEKHRTKTGKVKGWFRGLGQSFSNHSYLFDLLPTGDKYTSVLVGSFTALVKVAVTYDSTAASINDCLERLSNQVRNLYRAMTKRPKSGYIKSQIAKFYCVLFQLLVKILHEWFASSAKRVLNCFGSALDNFVQDSMEKLEYYARIAREELVMEITLENNDMLLKLGVVVEASLVGQAITLTVPGMAVNDGKLIEQSPVRNTSNVGRPVELPDELEKTENTIHQHPSWTSETIREETERFKKHLQDEKVAKLRLASRELFVNCDIYARLHKWSSQARSEALWIEGPASMPEPSQNTLTSAFMLANIRRLGIPVIAYFCTYEVRQYTNFSRPEELMKMVYALIYQVSRLLPENLCADEDLGVDLSSSRFDRLTGEAETLHDAINLLADLLSVGPPLLFCIVDELRLLDRESDSPSFRSCLKQLIEILCRAASPPLGQTKIRKILFSTDGVTWMLRDAVKAGFVNVETYSKERNDEPLRLREVDLKKILK